MMKQRTKKAIVAFNSFNPLWIDDQAAMVVHLRWLRTIKVCVMQCSDLFGKVRILINSKTKTTQKVSTVTKNTVFARSVAKMKSEL
jgi:hypothetical protein